MTTATATKTTGAATITSMPSTLRVAMQTKKSNSLHDSRATTRPPGIKPEVTLREAKATTKIFMNSPRSI
jgi:hypothetical protein